MEQHPIPPPAAPAAVSLRSVSRVFGGEGRSPNSAHRALDDVSLDLARGRLTAIMGPSGSGKTTLLHCAAGLDRPTAGSILLGDVELTGLSERALTELRRRRVGFVFQAYNLVAALTVAENVVLPSRFSGEAIDPAWVDEVIARVGLGDRARHLPSELSGGEQQRAAIARAVVARPDVVFADEPTGALDRSSGHAVLALFREVVDHAGQTVVLVTHDPTVAATADRVVLLGDGHIVADLDEPPVEVLAEHLAASDPGAITSASARYPS